tara:strand:+ start:461 stop:1033 length:573 start_codon:yes stop_codon:yes gene_type:complete
MEIKRFIRIFDGFLNDDQNAKFLKFIKSKTSHPGTIITDEHGTLAENDDVRNVEVIGLDLDSDPATSYWFHITKYLTQNLMNNYKEVTGSKYLNPVSIENPQILKYPPGGKYNVHVDYYKTLPRMLSLILFINDDYEGGDLIMHNSNSTETEKIEKKKNRCVIFPSNHLYPHAVTPVTKGTRYTMVTWIQ